MGRYEKITAEVTDEMAAFMREAVASGAYASSNEVIRDAMMGWMQSGRATPLGREELKRLLDTGRDSGPTIPAEDVFDRLIAKYKSMVETQESKA